MKYKKLQNGSDIRGVSLSGIENEEVNLERLESYCIGVGFSKWLRKNGKKQNKISVGRDSRVTGSKLLDAISGGIFSEGDLVFESGISSTPAMFMSTVLDEYKCDGAVMITASHLPMNRNGFKFFTKDGGLNKKDIREILDIARETEKICEESFKLNNNISKIPLMESYCEFLKKIIVGEVKNGNKPLKNLKIVVDAGNGAGGFYAEKVLKPLGADVSDSQFLEPDGTFPNHIPNPENREAMKSISKKVVESNADLGLIFDTDVDRAAAVDKNGQEISRNKLIALMASLVSENNSGSTVVTDSITSNQLTEFIESNLGLKHKRYMRGYKNVINESIRLNENGEESCLAIETSGHGAMKENYFLDDGAYLATKIVIKSAILKREEKDISYMIKDLKEPLEEFECRIPLSNENFSEYADNILEDLENWVGMKKCAKRNEEGKIVPVEDGKCNLCHCGMSLASPNYEGVRIDFDKENGDGWCLVRKSLHDPIMPINIESNEKNGCEKIWNRIKNFLSAYENLKL